MRGKTFRLTVEVTINDDIGSVFDGLKRMVATTGGLKKTIKCGVRSRANESYTFRDEKPTSSHTLRIKVKKLATRKAK